MPLRNLDQSFVIAASLVQTLSWKERKAKLITQAEQGTLNAVLQRLLPLTGASNLIG